MSQPLDQMSPSTSAWCGRSWEGLIDRRSTAFGQAHALKNATDRNSRRVMSDFLDFFDTTGAELMRDEEEWIFSTLRPAPAAVINALEEHIRILSLIHAVAGEAEAECVDPRVLHHLGELLETHLLAEEEEIRPLVTA